MLRIFDSKSTEFRRKTDANLTIVMNHAVTYFGPKECVSEQKRYISYKMEKPHKLTIRQYVRLVSDQNASMAHMPSLFHEK